MLDNETRKAIRAAFDEGLLSVRTVAPTGQVSEHPVSDVLQHHTPNRRAFRVTLESGASVVTTQDHSLFTMVAGEVSPIRTDALKPGTPVIQVWEGATTVVPVQAIEEVPPLAVSYDLSVPGPENFVLAEGILAHNSYSIGGVSLDLDKASKYESAASMASDQFDKQLEKAKQTVKFCKGLQQPRYGTGIRSAFGPYSGSGILTPAKFMGF